MAILGLPFLTMIPVWVIVAISQHGNKYIKTKPDGDQPNNLLSLPECP